MMSQEAEVIAQQAHAKTGKVSMQQAQVKLCEINSHMQCQGHTATRVEGEPSPTVLAVTYDPTLRSD